MNEMMKNVSQNKSPIAERIKLRCYVVVIVVVVVVKQPLSLLVSIELLI